jgi:serine/threonine protein kinase
MMVLSYCEYGNLRDILSKISIDYQSKLIGLLKIANGLLNIHNNGKIHKDLHSGNILFHGHIYPFISDLGMCQPANNEKQSIEGVYGVLPYMAPEVLRGHQYTMASDIYSFGTIMNEYMSEEIPYNDVPHGHVLAVKICKGFRPSISEDTPKLIADLIIKCWDAETENRPTAKEIYQVLNKLENEANDHSGIIYSQIKECEKFRTNKLKNRSNKIENNSRSTHPQAIYTSRLLNFENLPEPTNSTLFSKYESGE